MDAAYQPVVRGGSPFSASVPDARDVEPAFLDATGHDANVGNGLTSPRLEHLAALICRNPADLRLHVQRALLAARSNEQTGLYGALLDLAGVLAGRGQALQVNLHARTRRLLTREQRELLDHAMGAAPSTLPDTADCRLPATGALQHLVETMTASGVQKSLTAVASALQSLDAGDAQTAQATLEAALASDPDDGEATQLLIEIYWRGRDFDAFEAMHRALSPASEAVRALWADAAERFGEAGKA